MLWYPSNLGIESFSMVTLMTADWLLLHLCNNPEAKLPGILRRVDVYQQLRRWRCVFMLGEIFQNHLRSILMEVENDSLKSEYIIQKE